MMAAYQVLLLNTAVPQIQAAQAGDTYVVPRDIAFSAALTLSAGTANGVPYLNGSKVLTTGSALTFDGTNFGIGGSASFKLDVISSSDVAGAIRSTGSSTSSSLLLSNGNGTTAANYSYIRYFNNSASPQEWRVGTYGDARFVWQNITAGSEAMCLTSTGLGIGASSPSYRLHLNSGSAVDIETGVSNSAGLSRFGTRGSGNSFAGSFTAGKALELWSAGSLNATLDSSGNLGLGVTPSAWGGSWKAFEQVGGSVWSFNFQNISLTQNAYHNGTNYIYTNSSAATDYQQSNGSHLWKTAPSGTAGNAISFTQAMTLDASGQLLVGTSTSSSSLSRFNWATNGRTVEIENTNASLTTDAHLFLYTERNTTNNSYYYFGCYNGTAGAWKLRIADSGDVTNTNGTYGTISDAKMKTDIVDAGSQWSDIKALRFRKFKMKDDPEQRVQLGVVAQEVEQTSPGLVDEHTDRDQEGNDLGTTTKSVKTSVLLMKAAVALQEAMARIETLEAEVAALKGN